MSSCPAEEQADYRIRTLSGLTHDMVATRNHALSWQDVSRMLTRLNAAGEEVLCCISVWEGYRPLMALANQQLGVTDLPVKQVDLLRDKLTLRNQLNACGLSRTRATLLTPALLPQMACGDHRYFIKPRVGLASCGTFSPCAQTHWRDLEAIRGEIGRDPVYQSAFGAVVQFIAEDYLPGKEYSFEVIALAGQPHVMAIHEKCELTEVSAAVLEDACVSPPVSLTPDDCQRAIAWIHRLFEQLELREGCFHVEARSQDGGWEVIEINPRVGGSFISHSVGIQNGQQDMLAIWLDTLLSQRSQHARLQQQAKLNALAFKVRSDSVTQRGTFFRVYFAHRGRIDSISLRTPPHEPLLSQLFLHEGDEITDASREIFLGQLLWECPRNQLKKQLPALLRESRYAIAVKYHPTTGVNL
ncbi:ATP-grasp domain-containing protein [Affinibrenneria salicis]|uniref:ATP-grasp domain-containing protein n=1 Tax=Affinibrenneria salicis TaxID=2590031 RepID=UPI00168A59A4|nr:ATP-grasp domain-containing protein [Affinibrenneria salicis]